MRVFEISRMTNHNGPGIRTLVHFKGCPLRCRWCSTPESQKTECELSFKPQRCIGCHACAEVCKTGAITPINGSGINLDRSKCVKCFACTHECYSHALTVIGQEYTPEELLKEIRKDELFFKNSGGGVTFSGGEPLMHVDAEMLELYRITKEAGISIGVDTTGYVTWETIESVLPYVDFFLWDLKVMSSELHKKFTGVPNELILENLRKVEDVHEKYGTKVIIRCVQIPGLTDFDKNLVETAKFLSGMKCIERVDLVNYHSLGKTRYDNIARPYPMGDAEPLPEEEMNRKRDIVASFGIPCRTSM